MNTTTADDDSREGPRFPRAPDELFESLEGEIDPATIAADWSFVVEISDRPFNAYAAWRHGETGLTVTVEHQTRPRQMHSPETASDDTGWIASARTDQGGEQLTHNLGGKLYAYQMACRLMAAFPDGDFEPEYRDIEWEGPRDPEDWQ